MSLQNTTMDNQKIKSTWDQADQLLQSAEREMNRAQEDVVPSMVCSAARQSMAKYLIGFLLQNGIKTKAPQSLNTLLDQCVEIEPRFNNLKLETMFCNHETIDESYCSDLTKVKSCTELAYQTKQMVVDKIWPEEK